MMASQNNWPIDTDVIVVGGGNAGLCAAVSAARLGAKVVVLEVGNVAMRRGQ